MGLGFTIYEKHVVEQLFFSHRSLDQGFQKNLAADEPNEETRPEVKTPNPGKRRLEKDNKKKEEDCTLILLKIFSRLRRGDFRYTKIFCLRNLSNFRYTKFFPQIFRSDLGQPTTTQRALVQLQLLSRAVAPDKRNGGRHRGK